MVQIHRGSNGSLEKFQQICDLGRTVLAETTYPIMPTRVLRPDLFEHPADSFDAKKALLHSLSPMLSCAETQRKQDTHAVEMFTRCKSSKSKGPRQIYEYIHIDTHNLVEYGEFERR